VLQSVVLGPAVLQAVLGLVVPGLASVLELGAVRAAVLESTVLRSAILELVLSVVLRFAILELALSVVLQPAFLDPPPGPPARCGEKQ